MKIHLDGWSSDFDFWTDDDWPDLHPPGWCLKTNHPLQPPLVTSNGSTSNSGECPTPGCTGVGHVEGARYASHNGAEHCPYANRNLHRENSAFPDRLAGEEVDPIVQRSSSPTAGSTAEVVKDESVRSTKAKVNIKTELGVGDSSSMDTSSPIPPTSTIKSESDQRKSKTLHSIDLPVKSESEAELNNRLIQVDLRPESPSLEQQYDSLEALTPPPKKMYLIIEIISINYNCVTLLDF